MSIVSRAMASRKVYDIKQHMKARDQQYLLRHVYSKTKQHRCSEFGLDAYISGRWKRKNRISLGLSMAYVLALTEKHPLWKTSRGEPCTPYLLCGWLTDAITSGIDTYNDEIPGRIRRTSVTLTKPNHNPSRNNVFPVYCLYKEVLGRALAHFRIELMTG